ncbi:MAG: Holliday junction resolvase [Thermoplasmata archaeon]
MKRLFNAGAISPGMAYSDYEREFKLLLQGDGDVVRRVIKSCDSDVHFNYLKILEKPFIVIRAAGSFGVDLVAIRGDVSFPIEVKASSSKLVHFSDSSGRALKQAAELKGMCERANVFPLYAHRLKGVRGEDPWRVSTVEIDGLSGRNKTLHRAIPRVHITKAGNIALNWDTGMALNKFIEYLC